MSGVVDPRNAQAKAALLEALAQANITGETGWAISVEQELTDGDLFVVKVSNRGMDGGAMIEASGYRSRGGFEYIVTLHSEDGQRFRGPLSFSYPGQAIHFARFLLAQD
jgi:hypothetical protein